MCDGRNFHEGGIGTKNADIKIEIENQLAIKPKETIKECEQCKPRIEELGKQLSGAISTFSDLVKIVTEELPPEYQSKLLHKIYSWILHRQTT